MLKHKANCFTQGTKFPYCSCRFEADGLPRWVIETLEAQGGTYIQRQENGNCFNVYRPTSPEKREYGDWADALVMFHPHYPTPHWSIACGGWLIWHNTDEHVEKGLADGSIVSLWDALEKEAGTIQLSQSGYYDGTERTFGPLFLPPVKERLKPKEFEQLEHLYQTGDYRTKGVRKDTLHKIKIKLYQEGLVGVDFKALPVVKWYFENN